MKTELLRVENLLVRYGKATVLADLDLVVREGTVIAIVGPNGAGKSTLLNALVGAIASIGNIQFNGERLRSLDLEQRVAAGIALVPESRALFGDLSVLDNLLLGAYRFIGPRGGQRSEDNLARIYDLFPRLQERRRQLAGTLSGGERQMLALGRALMMQPRLLLLDEPSIGLAPRVTADVFGSIAQLKKAGVTIVLVEQNARAALAIADEGHVLETGRLVLSGPASELAQDPRIIETYLGSAVS
ncbi:ABC transporter ATP-binding protein [Variovorax sp. Root411]|uniref:ABC transporter ATP-binding protein n=1 Tax=Variovorax sp. Root411 TaxID=1736530 RepID=UPI0006FC7867|nr:ABC transporter ATP-binding protein [Variovorax sp. Root411]KQW54276.1 ABC transporter ATP-binding protein [Variovorax sp. Root411]